MKILEEFGMKRIGEWELSHHKSTKHLCHLNGINFYFTEDIKSLRDILYAFVIDSCVVYIGESTRGLCSRFEGYRYGNNIESDTDNRIKIYITSALMEAKCVEIWYSQPKADFELPNGEILNIPASKPIEEHLIEKLTPELNVKNLNAVQLSK